MSRERYEAFRNTDVGQRLLNTIAFAEGTAGPRGYNTMFTHAQFDNNFVDHPRQLQRSNGLASDAAGRYQFLSTTWDPTARALGLNDFSPVNQDIGALYKAEQRLAQKGLSLDDLVEVGMSKEVADALAPEWASFPTAATGTSYYGQGGKSLEELQSFYGGNYQNQGPAAPGYGRARGSAQINQTQPEVKEGKEKNKARFAASQPFFTALRTFGDLLGF